MKNYVEFGCKNCGSPHLRERDGKLRCSSCGMVFEVESETPEERDARILYLSRLDEAEKRLRMSPPRFDDAEDHFRDFIKQYPEHSDGYWGLVRARYGIKYEDDVSGKEIPSCYKSSYEDFRKDSDFLKALELAENDNIYDALQNRAKLIAGVCKEWREEANRYDYDIFISFKATDDISGEVTSDRHEMDELYTYLLEEHYKVFFSPRSMHRYNGKHYDAYIYNALQKAKVMIVYGSKPEYFTSTWVQNEWTRFLRMEAKGKKKKGSCVVAYKDFNPKELPPSLRKIQAINADDKKFYIQITDCIKTALTEEKKVDPNAELQKQIEELKLQQEENLRQLEEAKRKADEEAKRRAEEEAKLKSFEEQTQSDYSFNDTDIFNAGDVSLKRFMLYGERYDLEKTLEEVQAIFASVGGPLDYLFSNCISDKKLQKSATNIVVEDDGICGEVEGHKICVGSIEYMSRHGVEIPETAIEPRDKAIVDTIRNMYGAENGNLCAKFYIRYSLSEEFTTKLSSLSASGIIPTVYTRDPNLSSEFLKILTKENQLVQVVKLHNLPNISDVLQAKRKADAEAKHKADEEAKRKADEEEKRRVKDEAKRKVEEAKYKAREEQTRKDCVIENGELKKYNGKLSSIIIPREVTSIGKEAFKDCTGLTSIIIPDGVTSIDNMAFYNCIVLTSITIPDSVTSIGNQAFWNCTGLTSITIPDSVTSIGDGSFQYCTGLTDITIPNSAKYIGDCVFADCTFLSYINVGAGNKHYKSIDGNLYSIDGNKLIRYAPAKKENSFKISSSVTRIDSGAFEDCKGLTSIIIPDSVTSIGNYAFYGCGGLTSIIIPDSVTSIGNYAFTHCTGLTDIIIPDSVTSFGNNAFRNCTRLTSITIPESVTSIGGLAFYGCTGLTSITIPYSVTSIGMYAFDKCTGLTSITIPDSVTSIKGHAFDGCKNIKIYVEDPKQIKNWDKAWNKDEYGKTYGRVYNKATGKKIKKNIFGNYV